MEKKPYTYSRQYTSSFDSIRTRPMPKEEPPAPPPHRKRARRSAGVAIVLCLLVATLAALLAPMLVGGETVFTLTRPVVAEVYTQPPATAYASLDDALAALPFEAELPLLLQSTPNLPSTACVLEGNVLEITYSTNKGTIIYRTAEGSEDLSYSDVSYAYTASEEDDGVTRTYSGPTEHFLNQAVWAANGRTYVIIASAGLSADMMHQVAASVAA